MSGGINYRGKLQEFLQKSGNTIPVYSTTQRGTLFVSTISFNYNTHNIQLVGEDTFNSKKQAEQYISQKALETLNKMLDKEYVVKSIIPYSYDVHILIDYENYSDDADIDRFKICNNNIKVIKYASSVCSKVHTADIIVDSTRQDASDVKMCCDVGVIFATITDPLVIIITKDHFASCLSDIYERCYHLHSIKDCVKKLSDFLF